MHARNDASTFKSMNDRSSEVDHDVVLREILMLESQFIVVFLNQSV
jgi:hypothetical protein